MASTIRNPIEWGAERLGRSASHIGEVAEAAAGRDEAPIEIRKLAYSDIGDALRAGIADLGSFRSDVVFLVIVYPIMGLALTAAAFDYSLLPLVFPAGAGFALVGPFAAVGLYELSRRREKGMETSWGTAFSVTGSPSFGAILLLGLALLGLFFVWMGIARVIHDVTMGPEPALSIGAFIDNVIATPAGWALIAAGLGTGFLFALLVLAVSVVSFPLLLDRRVGIVRAVRASLSVFAKNPGVILGWGAVVAGLLLMGSLPAFLGLVVVLPLLGHATWHLYRRAVEPRVE